MSMDSLITPVPIIVYKIAPDGHERHYPSAMIARTTTSVVLEGPFSLPHERDMGYVVFRPGDRCVEYFHTDRWYTILELHDVGDDHLKGWYCDIARPAQIGEHEIRYDDLALDLWVAPDGSTRLLDEDEFAAYSIDDETRRRAWIAVDELKAHIARRAAPFDQIG